MDGDIFEYRGYEMRSHSETRWASMMDYVGIRWLYEPRTYRTRHGGYLPDFYLPDARCFLEIKGPDPTKEEMDKAVDVEASTGIPVIFGYGSPKLDGVYLGEGYLQYGHVLVTLYQVSEGLARAYGENYAMGFAMSGRIQPPPSTRMLGDLVESYVRGMMARSIVEKQRAALHAPLNAAKLEALSVPTLSAYVVARSVEILRRPA